jgi:hypothetical protein
VEITFNGTERELVEEKENKREGKKMKKSQKSRLEAGARTGLARSNIARSKRRSG